MSKKKNEVQSEELENADVTEFQSKVDNLKEDIEKLKELKKKQKKLIKLEREKNEILKHIIREQRNENKKH